MRMNRTDGIYPASKVATIGKNPLWFVYLLTHNERSRGFKCYTYVGVSRNPFRKHMQHRMRALPQCKTTRPAAKHWILAEVIGPFEEYRHANEIRHSWRDATRGENGRHVTGMLMVHLINSYDNNEDFSFAKECGNDELSHLEDYAKINDLQLLVRCFSSTVSDPVPFFMLKDVPSSQWLPSTSTPLSMEDVERITGHKRKVPGTVRKPVPSPFDDDKEDEKEEDVHKVSRRMRRPTTKKNRWGIHASPFDDI